MTRHPLTATFGVFWMVWFIWGYYRGDPDRDLIYRGFFATMCLIGAMQP